MPYDQLVVFASLVTLAGLLVAVVLWHRQVGALCGIPVLYMVPPLTLASIDRYAFRRT
ncbi:MAG: hypothetical protein M3461_18640 [Pseudomonadota bacterium]|nr:hypothetical protein [Pseudomonadota bacterium]